MQVKEDMTVVDDTCTYRPQGSVSLVEGVAMVARAIERCRAGNIRKMLIDVTELTGYPIPTIDDRFWLAQDWAQAAQGALIVAVVALPEYIHPAKFGVRVAADAGLKSDVFTLVADAEAWLRANEPDPPGRSKA
jgi:hypothetical protein